MKKAIVPLCIVLVILLLVFIIIHGNEDIKAREKLTAIQPTRLVSEKSVEINDNEAVTVIGTPEKEVSILGSVADENDTYELIKSIVARPSQILYRNAYITSYNKSTRCPNWVAWHLTREHTDGPYPRKGAPYYAEDGTVYGIGKVTPETNKGDYFLDMECEEPRQELNDWSTDYDMSHGHMCPAGDNKWDRAAMNQTFLLTNMCPQDAKLNSGGWNRLEEKCRTWAKKYEEIYIVAGPVYKGKPTRYLGQIAVPDAFFKVILCMQGTPKAIGFLYENDPSSQSMKDKVCSVDEVESITGFDFFSSLPDEIEDSVESSSDFNQW